MNVPSHLKTQVNEAIQKGIDLAEAHYGIKIQWPNIIYTKRGCVAGTANGRDWEINLNGGLLVAEGQNFIVRTPVHELAHLVTRQVYPQSLVRGARGNKRDVHGAPWQEVMRVMGVSDPTRCHSYDVSTTKQHKTPARKYQYKCGCEDRIFSIGGKRHNKIQRYLAAGNRSPYHCRICKTPITIAGHTTSNIAPVRIPFNDEAAGIRRMQAIQRLDKAVHRAAAAMPNVQVQVAHTPAIFQPTTMFKTKMDMCRHIMKFGRLKSRQDLINEMINEAGCTQAGAATYYATLKKEMGL